MKKLITVVELTPFIHAVQDVWADAERASFTTHIAENYEDGDLIQGTGGLRKIRWKRPASAKAAASELYIITMTNKLPFISLPLLLKMKKRI